jgi:hypothetical protein
LWRATAALAAVALAVLVFFAAPGSVTLMRYSPLRITETTSGWKTWAGPCLRRVDPMFRRGQLAFCARVDGRVIGSHTSGTTGETHLLVLGAFHATLVELQRGTAVPSWGSRIIAVGPLSQGDGGLRELQAVWLHVG